MKFKTRDAIYCYPFDRGYALKKGERARDPQALLTTLLCKPCPKSIL